MTLYPLVFDSLLGVRHDLLHVVQRHDLVHLLQTLVPSLESLHNLQLNLGKLDVVHHLLQVVELLVRLVQKRFKVALLFQQQLGPPEVCVRVCYKQEFPVLVCTGANALVMGDQDRHQCNAGPIQ